MSSGKIVVWGAQGHASVVCGILRARGCWEIVGLIDDINPAPRKCEVEGISVLGSNSVLRSREMSEVGHVIVAIGDNKARVNNAEQAMGWGYRLATAIHPSAIVDGGVPIGSGTVIVAGAVVNPGARIGTNVIINTMASVDHECEIGDGAHIGPGVHLGGRVRIGTLAWIGIGTVVRDRVSVGKGSIVGAGSVVVKDIPALSVAFGVPARRVRGVS